VATVKRVRDLTDVNLLGLVGDQKAVGELFADDVKLCEVLCAVIRPQLEAARKKDDDFFAVIDGQVIETAAEALLREIVNFFQEPRRTLLKTAMEKYQAAYRKVREEGAAAAEKAMNEIDFETSLRQTLTSSASSSPVSAA
jgi:flagellar biosynthesis/type III secretory pathway protein FliH